PTPTAIIIYPNCDTVENANTFLLSNVRVACNAANKAVIQPVIVIRSGTQPTKRKEVFNNRNTPAATIVAACNNADTGVGPAIASGSHTYNGNCADLPTVANQMVKPATKIHTFVLAATGKV